VTEKRSTASEKPEAVDRLRGTMDATKIQNVANRWAAKHPELAPRIFRAVALTGGIHKVDDNTYRVEGATGDYTVTINRAARTSSCTCPDTQQGGNHCKHRLACALIEMAER
jgi:hypothetical protein